MKLTNMVLLADIKRAVAGITHADLTEFRCQHPQGDLEEHLTTHYQRSFDQESGITMRVLLGNFGEPLLIGGWSSRTGVAWFLTTVDAKDYPVLVLRAIKECQQDALEECPRLWNIVMKTNTQHVKLLESIGATFEGPIWGLGGEPFQAFIIDKEV